MVRAKIFSHKNFFWKLHSIWVLLCKNFQQKILKTLEVMGFWKIENFRIFRFFAFFRDFSRFFALFRVFSQISISHTTSSFQYFPMIPTLNRRKCWYIIDFFFFWDKTMFWCVCFRFFDFSIFGLFCVWRKVRFFAKNTQKW